MYLNAPDGRESPYSTKFPPSIGEQTRSALKAIVLKNSSEIVILLRMDLIYVADALLFAIEDKVSQKLGIDLHDKIIITATHTHSGYGDFWANWTLYLGHDMYVQEIFDRMVSQSVDVILSAYNSLKPAKIGFGFNPSFDDEGNIFSDRRSENNVLGPNGELIWGNGGVRIRNDIEPRGSTKDNRLSLIRIDDKEGNPIAAIINFGLHGTVLGGLNLFISGDSVGHVEWAFQETFNHKVVAIFIHGATGDVSPRGDGNEFRDFQRLEKLGKFASYKIRNLFDSIATFSEVDMEIVSRQVPLDRKSISIVRDGKKLSYGEIVRATEFDGDYFFTYEEFNHPYGAVECGATCDSDPSTIKGEGQDNAYLSCLDVEKGGKVVPLSFKLPPQKPPLEVLSTRITAIRINEYLILTLPGEPISILSDMLRKLVPSPFSFEKTIVFGYAQDHEGYLHTRFDWLQGGGAEVVNFWGPLFGEYIMDQSLELAKILTTLEKEDVGGIKRPVYNNFPSWKMQPFKPEKTSQSGKIFKDYQVSSDGKIKKLERFEIAKLTWLGGDPIIDSPKVTLQYKKNGVFEDVLLQSGRKLTDAGPEMILRYNPYPIKKINRNETQHRFTIDWETTKETEPGIYRFKISGTYYDGIDTTFPYQGKDYTIFSTPFEVIPSTSIKIDDIKVEPLSEESVKIKIFVSYPPNPQIEPSFDNMFVENDELLRTGQATFDQLQLLSFRIRDLSTPPFLPSPIREGKCNISVYLKDGSVLNLSSNNITFGYAIVESTPENPLPPPDKGVQTKYEVEKLKKMLEEGEELPKFEYPTSSFEFILTLSNGINSIAKVEVLPKGVTDKFGNYNKGSFYK